MQQTRRAEDDVETRPAYVSIGERLDGSQRRKGGRKGESESRYQRRW